LKKTSIDRDKVNFNIITNLNKPGKTNDEIVRKLGKRTELGEVGKKVMANPFIFSIGGVNGDSTFVRGKKTFDIPLTIRKPDYFPLIDTVDRKFETETKTNRVNPAQLGKAGKPSKYVYLNESSKPIPSFMPLSLAEVLRASPDIAKTGNYKESKALRSPYHDNQTRSMPLSSYA
jgi:hypothetical protein